MAQTSQRANRQPSIATPITTMWCWWYRKYAPGDVILEETRVRASGIGLWADPQPVPQWEWRKRLLSKGK